MNRGFEELPVEPFAAALAALNDEQTLGRYELLAPLGRGGMAVVWAARLHGTRGFSKLVALKTMLPALSSDPRFERMFLTEAEIASRIKHPNVGEILDLGEDNGVLYFAMELVDGEALSTLMRVCEDAGEEIPYAVAARIIAQSARGLHAAHELQDDEGRRVGVIHRDVSPQNILVGVDGLVKIVDFGVAKAAQRSENVTSSGFIKGKVAYLAPEQVAGPNVDARVDVFALGAVLYELTARRHPFRAGTDLATLLEISSDDPAPRPSRPDYPDALWAIVSRALSKDPSQRHASMRELAQELEALYDAEPEDCVPAFVARILAPRRKARTEELREAARVADDRSMRRLKNPTTPAEAIEPVSKNAASAPRSMRFRNLAIAVAGIAIGAIGVRASDGMKTTSTPSPTTVVAMASMTAAPPSTPIEPPTASAPPPAETAPPKPAVVVRSTPKLTASSSPPPAASASVTAPPPAVSSVPAMFRRPGF